MPNDEWEYEHPVDLGTGSASFSSWDEIKDFVSKRQPISLRMPDGPVPKPKRVVRKKAVKKSGRQRPGARKSV